MRHILDGSGSAGSSRLPRQFRGKCRKLLDRVRSRLVVGTRRSEVFVNHVPST